MQASRISRFSGEHAFLSNFSRSPFRAGGVEWPTVEHFFNAMKTTDAADRESIRLAPTPGKAKQLGRRVRLRDGWDRRLRYEVMRYALACKFAPGSELASRLLATGDAYLEEGNFHGDRHWGTVDGVGSNYLGQFLMQRRELLRNAAEHGSR